MRPIANLDEVEFNDIEDNGYFHNHHDEEEMFLILEGKGVLRFGNERHAIRQHDVIACPTGGPEVAHQIINTGSVPLRYLAVSNLVEIETCPYPDSDKIMIAARQRGRPGLRKMFKAEDAVDYYERESKEPPAA
jgi:uncharacterized cupin superfamily protein